MRCARRRIPEWFGDLARREKLTVVLQSEELPEVQSKSGPLVVRDTCT